MSLVAFFPHDLLGFISLTNTDGGDIANEALLRRIVDDYFGVNVISERFDMYVVSCLSLTTLSNEERAIEYPTQKDCSHRNLIPLLTGDTIVQRAH